MRGRKPFLVVAGSSPVRGELDPPGWLDEDAREEWNRVAPILIKERRTLTAADISTFTSYCLSIGQVAGASRIVAAEGMIVSSKTGPKKHPAIAIRDAAMTQARLLAGELGLTPVSRSRPSARDAADTGQDDLFSVD